MMDEMPEPITLGSYEDEALRSDQKSGKDAFRFALLGLVGETGSLLSEAKKRQRDKAAYVAYAAAVAEELGDVLWYLSLAASCCSSSLSEVAFYALPEKVEELGANPRQWKIGELQHEIIPQKPEESPKLEPTLLALASAVGNLAGKALEQPDELDDEPIKAALQHVFKLLIDVSTEARASLEVAALKNNRKTADRWPTTKKYPELFDEHCEPFEKLPRYLEIDIVERDLNGNKYVYQSSGDINIGDRLTDNAAEDDDYRFHDVFHYAYAAVLGWSPVLRAILRLKRKSNSKTDEVEDGARAILIEEGLANWVFNFAQKLEHFDGMTEMDLPLGFLRTVREFTSGYEPYICPLWLWEEAILQGFQAFRYLRENRQARLVIDMRERQLLVKEYVA